MRNQTNGQRRLTSTELATRRQESLEKAQNGQSLTNYPTIYEGFALKGIPETDVLPRVNVYTYGAWIAKGRQVNRGEHGVKIITYYDTDETTGENGETVPGEKRCGSATVFHISQTKEREAR